MYYIFMDGRVLYNPSTDDELVMDPIIDVSMGLAGTCSFTVPFNNPLYNYIHKLKSVVRVYKDHENIWSGRVLDTDLSWNKNKSVACEGDIGLLNDSYLSPMDEDMALPAYLQHIITNHNNQVDDFKRFVLGDITVNYANETDAQKSRVSGEYQNTKAVLDGLVSTYGGYFVARPRGILTNASIGEISHPTETISSQYITLDYLAEYPRVSTQQIVFGRNMLDLTNHIKGENIKTVLIPLGKNGMTIEYASQSGGADRIEDAAAISLFGRVVGTVTHNDIDDEDELYTAGLADLAEKKNALVSIELKAVDLSLVDADIDSFHVGDKVRVISPPHGLSTILPVAKMRLDLANPDKSELTVGAELRTLTAG